jgi:hypothetical protein
MLAMKNSTLNLKIDEYKEKQNNFANQLSEISFMNKQLGEQVKLEQTKKIKAESDRDQAEADRQVYVDQAEFYETKYL